MLLVSVLATNSLDSGLKQHLGVTEPISLAFPTEQNLKDTAALEKQLRDFGLFESAEESQKREELLGKLNALVKEWIRQVSVRKVSKVSSLGMTISHTLVRHRAFQSRWQWRQEGRSSPLVVIG